MVFAMRVIDAKRFIQFEVGWKYLAPTLVLLITQSILLLGNRWLENYLWYLCNYYNYHTDGSYCIKSFTN